MSQSQQMHTAMMPLPVQPSPTATDNMGETRTKKKPRNAKGAVAVSMSTTQMGSATENTNMMVVVVEKDPNALTIFLLIACTLAWFLGLHISTQLGWNAKGEASFPLTTITMENCLDFRCFLVTVLITLGALSLQPNILHQKCAKVCAMIPFYAFPPFAVYFLLETATVLWKFSLTVQRLNRDTADLEKQTAHMKQVEIDNDPRTLVLSNTKKLEGLPVARYLLDAICCLVIACLLVCLHFVARRKSQEWEQQESTQQYQQQATHGYAPYNIPSSPSMMPMPPPHHNPSEEQQQQNNQQANSELTVTLSSGQAAPGHPAAMPNENKPRKPSMLPVPA